MKSLKTLSFVAATLIGAVVALPASADTLREPTFSPEQLQRFAAKEARLKQLPEHPGIAKSIALLARDSASISS